MKTVPEIAGSPSLFDPGAEIVRERGQERPDDQQILRGLVYATVDDLGAFLSTLDPDWPARDKDGPERDLDAWIEAWPDIVWQKLRAFHGL